MLRRTLFFLMLALAVTAAATASPGRLRVMSLAQFAVQGTSFHAREHVLLVASAGENSTTKRVTAGPGGGFVARFPTLRRDGSCLVFRVRATGDRGTRAALTVRQPECPPPPTP